VKVPEESSARAGRLTFAAAAAGSRAARLAVRAGRGENERTTTEID